LSTSKSIALIHGGFVHGEFVDGSGGEQASALIPVSAHRLELNPALKRDHARGAVAPQPNAQQPRRWRDRAFERSESSRNLHAWHSRFDLAWQSKIGMIERVEHLGVEAKCDPFFDWESLGDVDVGIRVMRSAYGVPPGIAELTVCS
jgi:hypothetical protein